jgi:iron complex outermembrane recepter protein
MTFFEMIHSCSWLKTWADAPASSLRCDAHHHVAGGDLKLLCSLSIALFKRRVMKGALFTLILGLAIAKGNAQQITADLGSKSIEELMNIDVTTVSKKVEKLFQTAAAIDVITREDIRRSGLTSIPEILRLAPGLNVGRISGNKWAISARGFNGRFANKLLVLIDGRSVYTPIHSGVYWELQDVLIEDIERIEVIRGPGGTLWGANAVNGIINIITSSAKDTQGGLLTTGLGYGERSFGGVRYGGKISEQAYYRIYGKYFDCDSQFDALGRDASDGQTAIRGGFRTEWTPSGRDLLTLQGDIYNSSVKERSLAIFLPTPLALPAALDGELSGANLLGRWNRSISNTSDTTLQLYFDRYRRETYDVGERVDTFDVDLQHHLGDGRRNDFIWGLNYRLISDRTNSNRGTPVQFIPQSRSRQLFGAFAQNEFTLIKDRLRFTLGAKLEHNDYTGFEFQPSVRLLWTPTPHQTFWGAISRAIRTPARKDRDLRVNVSAFPGEGGLPSVVALFGTPDFKSEELRAYEFGYRTQPDSRFLIDFAAFYNRYDRLSTAEPGFPFVENDPQPTHLLIPLYFKNLLRGETYGFEAAATLNLTRRWKARGSYSFLRAQLHRAPTSQDPNAELGEGDYPQRQLQIHSILTLPRNFELDASIYRISALAAQSVPGYTRLDVRFGWRVKENVELSLSLQNLLDKQHPESNSVDRAIVPSQARRTIYGKASWRF